METIREKIRLLEKRGVDLGDWKVVEKKADDKDWVSLPGRNTSIPRRFPAISGRPRRGNRPVRPTEKNVLSIDPGLAFGSGFHDTTCMCVQYLEDTVKAGDTVLDIGTGTGILAIAAAKLGASHVTAVDFDGVAVKQAAVNAKLNGVEDKLTIANSDLLAAIPQGERPTSSSPTW